MKAAYLTGHGGVDKLVYGDLPDPVAGPGEVVVDVHAASVNAADYKVRLGGGAYSGASNLKFPYILGRDFSGLVSALGAGVTDFKVGDTVFGVMDAGIEGCYAEKVKIAAAIIAKKPAKLDHAEAAAMALTSLTAIWALEDTARLKPGETILIQGGAGGVAGFAIQLAKHIGATVVATASASRTHERTAGGRRGMAAGDHPLQAERCGRGAPGQRRAPSARQAGADPALIIGRLREMAGSGPARTKLERRDDMAGNGDMVIELDKKRMTAMAQKDLATLNELIADDLIYTHSSARLDTKQSLIGNMESGSTVYTSVVPSDVKAQDLGDTVVLTGSCKISVNAGGRPNSFGVRFTDVYARRGGKWQMVTWQSTRLPD